MAQLGAIQPPITGPTPTNVPGENQISEANTPVRDDGTPGGRGLVRSQPCSQPYQPVQLCPLVDTHCGPVNHQAHQPTVRASQGNCFGCNRA